MTGIDSPREVRGEDAFDEAVLADFLRRTFPDDFVAPGVAGRSGRSEISVSQFPGGHSNLTYLVRFGAREAVLRRAPHGASVKTAHDMRREFAVLSALAPVYSKAPKALAYCEDASVIGVPFFLMERVEGVILRGSRPPPGLPLPPERARDISTALIDNLAALHALDVTRSSFAGLGRPEGYVARQVGGWTERYFRAKTDEIATVEKAAVWIAKNTPAESGAALIHNDYKYDNLVLDASDLARIVAVLDWEMATVGDPLMDLGTALGYWVDHGDAEELKSLAFGPTLLPGSLSRVELAERYEKQSGRAAGSLLFYYVFALFKTAVIAQQIYKRFKEGHSKDPRFGTLIHGVRILGEQAVRVIGKGRIHDLR